MGKINNPGQDLDNLPSKNNEPKKQLSGLKKAVTISGALVALILGYSGNANAEGNNKIPDEIAAQIEGAEKVTREELDELCSGLPVHTKMGKRGCKNAITIKLNKQESAKIKAKTAKSEARIAQLNIREQQIMDDLKQLIHKTAEKHSKK